MFGSNGATILLPSGITVAVAHIISYSQVKEREGGDHVFTVTTGATGHRIAGTEQELQELRNQVAKAIEKHYG